MPWMAFWGSVARFPVDVVLWHVDSFRGFQRPAIRVSDPPALA